MLNRLRIWAARFLLLLKAQLKGPQLWLLLAFCLMAGLLFPRVHFPDSATRQIGLMDLSEDGSAGVIIEELKEGSGPYEFILYDDMNLLRDDVTTGKCDCALIFEDNFREVLAGGSLTRAATLLCSPSTVKGEMLKEKVFSLVLRRLSDAALISLSRDGETFESESGELTDMLIETNHLYQGETTAIELTYASAGDSAGKADDTPAEKNGEAPLLALLVFAVSLFVARFRFSDDCRRISTALKKGESHLFLFLDVWIPCALSGILCGILCHSVGMMTYYPLLCALWSTVFVLFFRREGLYLLGTVSALSLSLIVSGAFFDFSVVLPALKILRWLFPAAYLP